MKRNSQYFSKIADNILIINRRRRRSQWQISFLGWNGVSGVYCVCSSNDKREIKIHYIGSSKDIGKRVLSKSHPYMKLHKQGLSVFIKHKECENYIELEANLIKRLKPELNIQHNKSSYGSR